MTAPVSGKMGSFRIHETLTRACLFEQHQTFTEQRTRVTEGFPDFWNKAKNKLRFCLPLVLCLIEGCFRPQGRRPPVSDWVGECVSALVN